MKLNELEFNNPSKALKDQYGIKLNLNKISVAEAKVMLKQIKSVMTEAKLSGKSHGGYDNPSYMKMVFMEQALSDYIRSIPVSTPKIVVENETVEKSQVVLATQDMVDSIQKMIEEVSDMLVKELPALTQSITSEVGVNESQQFQDTASEALTSLQTALNNSKQMMQQGLDIVTGQESTTDMFEPDMDADQEELEIDSSAEEIQEPEFPESEPELDDEEIEIGRAKR